MTQLIAPDSFITGIMDTLRNALLTRPRGYPPLPPEAVLADGNAEQTHTTEARREQALDRLKQALLDSKPLKDKAISNAESAAKAAVNEIPAVVAGAGAGAAVGVVAADAGAGAAGAAGVVAAAGGPAQVGTKLQCLYTPNWNVVHSDPTVTQKSVIDEIQHLSQELDEILPKFSYVATRPLSTAPMTSVGVSAPIAGNSAASGVLSSNNGFGARPLSTAPMTSVGVSAPIAGDSAASGVLSSNNGFGALQEDASVGGAAAPNTNRLKRRRPHQVDECDQESSKKRNTNRSKSSENKAPKRKRSPSPDNAKGKRKET
jgi:hypothetical protein